MNGWNGPIKVSNPLFFSFDTFELTNETKNLYVKRKKLREEIKGVTNNVSK